MRWVVQCTMNTYYKVLSCVQAAGQCSVLSLHSCPEKGTIGVKRRAETVPFPLINENWLMKHSDVLFLSRSPQLKQKTVTLDLTHCLENSVLVLPETLFALWCVLVSRSWLLMSSVQYIRDIAEVEKVIALVSRCLWSVGVEKRTHCQRARVYWSWDKFSAANFNK